MTTIQVSVHSYSHHQLQIGCEILAPWAYVFSRPHYHSGTPTQPAAVQVRRERCFKFFIFSFPFSLFMVIMLTSSWHFYTFLTKLTHYIYYHTSGILADCGFNIDLFITCSTKKWDLCHMCILISRQDSIVEQAHQMTEDFVSSLSPPSLLNLLPPHMLVYAAQDFMKMSMILHKLLLAEMSVLKTDYLKSVRTGFRAQCSPSQRLGYHFLETFIWFDSIGRNKTYLSGSLKNKLGPMGTWNLHMRLVCCPSLRGHWWSSDLYKLMDACDLISNKF